MVKISNTGKRDSREFKDWRYHLLEEFSQFLESTFPMLEKEIKWKKPSNSMQGIPVWSFKGLICTGETYKDKVKFTFAKGASIKDPGNVFNSSLEGKTRRAIDIHKGVKLDKTGLKAIIIQAIELNQKSKM
jgi:hypothetical protein